VRILFYDRFAGIGSDTNLAAFSPPV